jgi:hypothetical protein
MTENGKHNGVHGNDLKVVDLVCQWCEASWYSELGINNVSDWPLTRSIFGKRRNVVRSVTGCHHY